MYVTREHISRRASLHLFSCRSMKYVAMEEKNMALSFQ